MVGKRSMGVGFFASVLTGAWAVSALATDVPEFHDPQRLIVENCGACHTDQGDGRMSRISDMRKTPEGWDMTIGRMIDWHDLEITPVARGIIVKHLADTQGLAPSETEGYRWALERRPNVVVSSDDEDELAICGRCHTPARVALQRRDADEWLKLVHTHLGEYPSTEYQAQARDRKWWEIASGQMPDALAAKYGLESDAWSSWREKAANPADLSGTWQVAGHQPGKGPYVGTMTVERGSRDGYATRWSVRFLDSGETRQASGDARIFTGYEWRGTARLGTDVLHEVYALNADGNRLEGRWFNAESDEIGGELVAVRKDGPATVLQVEPAIIPPGQTTRVTIHGAGLGRTLDLGPGVEVTNVTSTTDGTLLAADVTAPADRDGSALTVAAGSARAENGLVVAGSIDRVTVEPPFTIARVGGGSTPPVAAQFELIGWLNGPDGEAGTDDDVRVGTLPATWSATNFDEVAAELEDAKFAGAMQSNGLFVPAAAGPNRDRPFMANNAGNLTITGSTVFNGQTHDAQGQLIVTVQKWIKRAIE